MGQNATQQFEFPSSHFFVHEVRRIRICNQRDQSLRAIEWLHERSSRIVLTLSKLIDRRKRQRVRLELLRGLSEVKVAFVPVGSQLWQLAVSSIKSFHRSRPQANAGISRSHKKVDPPIVQGHHVFRKYTKAQFREGRRRG